MSSKGVGLESTSSDNHPDAGIGPRTAVAHVDAFFPCVHGHDTGEMVQLQAFAASKLKATIKITSPAIDDTAAQHVVGASRFGERDSKSALGVIASVSNPSFSGNSYQLTLAITDKLARYGWARVAAPLIATGRIPTNGCGRVESIDGLETKLRLILRDASPGSIFVFPAANQQVLSSAELGLLEEIEARDIMWQAISHIDELEGQLWNSPESATAPTSEPYEDSEADVGDLSSMPATSRSRASLFVLVTVALAGAVLVWTFVSDKKAADVSETVHIPFEVDIEGNTNPTEPTVIENASPQASGADERPATSRPLESGFINTEAY